MGGSGGGGFFSGSSKPEEMSKGIRRAEEQARDEVYDAKVSSLVREVLAYANDRDVYTIQEHLESIKSAIMSELEGTIDLRYGGSVAKHTYVDGLSDIDCLAILNKSELSGMSPDEVKSYFAHRLEQSLPGSIDVKVGALAITLTFPTGFEIQVLPALKTSTGIKIPSSRRDDEWSRVIRPDNFAKILRYSNQQMEGKLVPVIKLAKSIVSNLPSNRQISGYHAESLAIEVFAKYKGVKTHKEMLKHFFSEGAKCVLGPVRDKTGQSVHVDDYLGEANSISRKIVSDSFATIGRKMQNADGSKETRFWEQLFK